LVNNPKRRLALLLAAFVALSAAAVWSLAQDPIIAARCRALWEGGISERRLTTDGMDKLDPPIGTHLPDIVTSRLLRAAGGQSAKGFIVVALATCSECTHFEFPAWQADAKRYGVRLLGFSSADPAALKAFRSGEHITMPIVVDAKGELGQLLNAYYAGRVYYFDRTWTLKWILNGVSPSFAIRDRKDLQELINGSL
jgi:hypothetical protein